VRQSCWGLSPDWRRCGLRSWWSMRCATGARGIDRGPAKGERKVRYVFRRGRGNRRNITCSALTLLVGRRTGGGMWTLYYGMNRLGRSPDLRRLQKTSLRTRTEKSALPADAVGASCIAAIVCVYSSAPPASRVTASVLLSAGRQRL